MLISIDQLNESAKRHITLEKKSTRSNISDLSEETLITDIPKETIINNILSTDDNLSKRKEMLETIKQEPVDFAFERAIGKNDSVYSNFVELIRDAKQKVGRIFIKNGSKKIGLKDIALAKQREYEKLDKAYREKETQLIPAIKKLDSIIVAIDQSIEKEQIAFTQLLNDGFVTRIEALNQLIKNNNAVAFRYYLLVMILLLIELMPVIAKTLLPTGPYDEKVRLREALEIELTQNNHRRELALKELYNQTAFEKDTTFINEFFTESDAERKSKMKEQFETWRTHSEKSFDAVWGEMKEKLLTKEEN